MSIYWIVNTKPQYTNNNNNILCMHTQKLCNGLEIKSMYTHILQYIIRKENIIYIEKNCRNKIYLNKTYEKSIQK